MAFIRFLVAGFAGATVATFFPCYVLTILPAPYLHRFGKRPAVVAFVDGVTAAAVGAITGAVVILGRRTMFERGWSHPEIPKVAMMLLTLGVLWRFKKAPEPLLVLAAAVLGLVLYPLVRN